MLCVASLLQLMYTQSCSPGAKVSCTCPPELWAAQRPALSCQYHGLRYTDPLFDRLNPDLQDYSSLHQGDTCSDIT